MTRRQCRPCSSSSDRASLSRRVGTRPTDLLLVADIVRRLDGMPLAIELAAGRLSTFSLAGPARSPRPRARPARRWPSPGRRTAPDAARDRRVVLPAAVRGRAAAVPPPRGVPGRRGPHHRRADRGRPGSGRRPGGACSAPPGSTPPCWRPISAVRRATGRWRRCAPSAWTHWSPPARRDAAQERLVRWAVDLAPFGSGRHAAHRARVREAEPGCAGRSRTAG